MKKTFSAPAVHFKGSGWARKERSSSGQPAKPAAAGSSGEGGAEPKASPPGES
jgi:predicted nucleic acid-binding Zn ribbon protein